MGSFFKFGQAAPEIFEFKWVFFRQDLEGTYVSEMAPKKKIFEGFLQFSWKKHS